MSRVHAPLDGWLRRGRPEPPPAHVEACAACRRVLAEADEVRSWFPATPPLPPDRAAAIRFVLQAEARRPVAPRRRRWPLVAAAGLALASAAAAAHGVHRLPPPSSPPSSVEPVVATRPPMRWSNRPTEPPHRRMVVAMVARPARGPDVDARFHTAWQLLGAGHAAAAATALDGLLGDKLDEARRADVLFWSAQAHATAGQLPRARERLETLLRDHPSSWHRADAEDLLRTMDP